MQTLDKVILEARAICPKQMFILKIWNFRDKLILIHSKKIKFTHSQGTLNPDDCHTRN